MSLPDVVQLLVAAGHDIQATRYAQRTSSNHFLRDVLRYSFHRLSCVWVDNHI